MAEQQGHFRRVDWCLLPDDVLHKVAELVSAGIGEQHLTDFRSMRLVCRGWAASLTLFPLFRDISVVAVDAGRLANVCNAFPNLSRLRIWVERVEDLPQLFNLPDKIGHIRLMWPTTQLVVERSVGDGGESLVKVCIRHNEYVPYCMTEEVAQFADEFKEAEHHALPRYRFVSDIWPLPHLEFQLDAKMADNGQQLLGQVLPQVADAREVLNVGRVLCVDNMFAVFNGLATCEQVSLSLKCVPYECLPDSWCLEYALAFIRSAPETVQIVLDDWEVDTTAEGLHFPLDEYTTTVSTLGKVVTYIRGRLWFVG